MGPPRHPFPKPELQTQTLQVTLRLWALRVMGSLPLRCRCSFYVVGESICVFPCDNSGNADLKLAFVLTSAEEDRVYSQVEPKS